MKIGKVVVFIVLACLILTFNIGNATKVGDSSSVLLSVVQEEFAIYQPGALEAVSNGVWQRTLGNVSAPIVAVPLQILNRYSSTNSVDVSGRNVGYDYQPILDDPFVMQPGVPFYFGSYFNVSQVEPGQVVRVIFRVDDNATGDQWVRLHTTNDNGQLVARVSLTSATANHGTVNIQAGQNFHFVIKGIWDGVSRVSYSYTIAPDLEESQTPWLLAGTFHSVSGNPKIGRILLGSSASGNQGHLTAIRLSNNYSDVVIPNNISNEPPAINPQIFNITEGAPAGTTIGNLVASDDNGIAQFIIREAHVLKSGVPFPSDALINASSMFSITSTGILRINDPTHLLSVNGPVKLTVEVRDTQGLFDQAIITININDLVVSPAEIIPVEWTAGVAMPFGTSEAQGVIVGSKWYVFSGYDGIKFTQSQAFTPTSRCYVYDFILKEWSPIAPMPSMHPGTNFGGVTHSGFTTDGTNIYFAGGFTSDANGGGQFFGTIKAFKYIIAEDRYETLPNFSGGRASGELEYVSGKLYYFGGTNVTRDQDQGDLFVLNLANLQQGWIKKAAMPNPRSHAGATVIDGKIYAVGGQHEHDEEAIQQDDIHMYDPMLDKWSKVTDLPDIQEVPASDTPGKSHITGATFSYAGKLYVLAGEYNHGGPYSTAVLSYDPASKSWTRFTDLPVPIASGVAGIYDATLFYSSGLFRNTTFEGILPTEKPFIRGSNPDDNATDIDINSAITVNDIFFPSTPGNGLDISTINTDNVKLFKLGEFETEMEEIAGTITSISAGGDAFTFSPANPLLPFTRYKFNCSQNIKLQNGLTFLPYDIIFTTGNGEEIPLPPNLAGVKFNKVESISTDSSIFDNFTTLIIGPDRKLYASTATGQIKRWTIQSDGSLSDVQIISPPLTSSRPGANGVGELRIIIGMAFDPISTADSLILYISHSKLVDFTTPPLPTDPPFDWDGKVTRLAGDNLENLQDILVHLPRSSKDHLTNSIVFGPDENRRLYVSQGSNSGGGEFDPVWRKKETLLSGAILRLDLTKLPVTLPLDVITTGNLSVINNAPQHSYWMSDGTYNPYASNSPLTIYASGIRNAYDLLFHNNGELYIPTNGTAGGNNTPASSDYLGIRRTNGEFYNHTQFPFVPKTVANENQKDWLFRVEMGGYYGHPNPMRGEFVQNHGGITYNGIPGQTGPYRDVKKYPSTLGPDPNYRSPAFDFGPNKSPNGIIEYQSNAFGGALQGMMLVTRFANGDDIILLQPDNVTHGIAGGYLGIDGLSDLIDPLDIIEDPANGNIYVSEFYRVGTGSRLTLLRPETPGSPTPRLAKDNRELIFYVSMDNQLTEQEKHVVLTNAGTAELSLSNLMIIGEDADNFSIENPSGRILQAGESIALEISFSPLPGEQTFGHRKAFLSIESNDVLHPIDTVVLSALKIESNQTTGEPPLSEVFLTWGYPVATGWSGLSTSLSQTLLGEEIASPLFVRAGNGPATMTPLARFSNVGEATFGWYSRSVDLIQQHPVSTLLSSTIGSSRLLFTEHDTIVSEFNPQGEVFGLYVNSGALVFSEDGSNLPSAHRVRVYPAKDRDGNHVLNSYLVVFETDGPTDYQDFVFLMKNVRPYENNYQLSFDKESLTFIVDASNIHPKPVILTATSAISGQAISLESSVDWIVLPAEVSVNSPLSFTINKSLAGNSSATGYVVAKAFGFISDTLKIKLKPFDDIQWVHQINFHDGSIQSPIGFREDAGEPYGPKVQHGSSLTYGWVLPGTTTPASGATTARNRNIATVGLLENTFNILNHTNPTTYPPRNWLLNVPNGEYYVNVSVGDPTADRNRNHIVVANDVIVVSFDERIELGLTKSDIEVVSVTDGLLRIAAGPGSFTTCINYIRVTPTDSTLIPPPDTLFLNFDKESLNFLVTGSTVSPKYLTVTPNVAVDASAISLVSTAPWLRLPQNIVIGQPMLFEIDTTGLDLGEYNANIVVAGENFAPDTVSVKLYYPEEIDWAYQVNFQDGSVVSPQGFIDDVGGPYGPKSIAGLDLVYGWVLPNTVTPASSTINTRNRNIAGVDVLINTFNILNHTNTSEFPGRDWLMNLPSGEYYIELSAGDPSADLNRNHVIKVQDDVLLSFDERLSPVSKRNSVATGVVSIAEDRFRISPGLNSFNTSLNYLRLSPLDSSTIIRPDSMLLLFDHAELDFILTSETLPVLTATLSANSPPTSEVTLTSTVPWISWTAPLTIGSPIKFTVDTVGLAHGNYIAEIVANADDFYADTLTITVKYLGTTNWTYKINFQDAATQVPAGYISDKGDPFSSREVNGEMVDFGWVSPGTLTPANSFSNARNRNVAGVSVLINTINIINHPNTVSYPARDWVMEVADGYYEVEVSVGDPFPDYNRKHRVDINGENIVSLDGQEAKQLGIVSRKGFNIIKAENGMIRLSQGVDGYITCVNWIHIAPLRTAFTPPAIVTTFDGVEVDNRYLGGVNVILEAVDQSGSGGIRSLSYQVDNLSPAPFTGTPVTVNAPGVHTMVVRATDLFGNESEETLSFEIKQVSQAFITLENTIKIPGSNRSFPSDTLFSFSKVKEPTNFEGITTKMHEKGTMVVKNTGVQPLVIDDITISDATQFSYQFVNPSQSLPIQIAAGEQIELQINFIEERGEKGIRKQTITFISNADNGILEADLYGAYQVRTENFDEINAEQIFESFGYLTSMNGVVRPSSDFPTDISVANGDFGDMILSKTFVQADPTKPLQIIQVSALHGTSAPIGLILLKKSSSDTVENFSFKHGQLHFQTLLPKIPASNTVPAGFSAPSIDEPFRIEIEGYRSSGGGFHGSNANSLLAIRTYKAVDGNGNVIPNEYFILQDNIANGCGEGSANCDWNDNTMYIINVRPEAGPEASGIDSLDVHLNDPFTYDVSPYFNPGYPGNRLTYAAFLGDFTNSLPVWISIDPETGVFQGMPVGDTTSLQIGVEVTDLNGQVVRSAFVLNVRSQLSLNKNSFNTARESTVVGVGNDEEKFDLSNVLVYPNPLEQNILTLDFGNAIYKTFFVAISNAQGIKVFETKIDMSGRSFDLELSHLPASLYNLSISDTGGNSVGKKLIIR